MTEPSAGRTVVVIRHAHSAEHGALADRQRPLDGRGRREAAAAGRWLRARELQFDLVLVSDAVRTRQTWDLIADQLSNPPEATIEPRIYDGGTDDLIDLLIEDRARLPLVAVLGHNPAVSELAWFLAGHEGPGLVPGAIAVIDAGTAAGVAPGHLVGTFTPGR